MFDIVGKAGLVGQDKVFCTDHVGMFVDLGIGSYEHGNEVDERTPRYLNSNNVRNIGRYIEHVKERVQRRKLGRAIERL